LKRVHEFLFVRSAVTAPDSSRVKFISAPKYQDANKHDTPPSQF